MQATNTASGTVETLIVGGSLGGLTTALALAAQGRSSTVLERTTGRTQRGVAILVAGARLHRAIGDGAWRTVREVLGGASTSQGVLPHAWWDVHQALRKAVEAEPLITLVEGEHVAEVGQDGTAAWARTRDGRTWTADALVGADGYRSVVRLHVDAARPHAAYAGYVVWLGQSELPPEYRGRAGGPDFFPDGGGMLAVYPLVDGDAEVTRFGWGWFDPARNALFRRIYGAMADLAERTWDEPWRSAVVQAFRDREVIATPIAEYLPDRVVSGRIALLGDAAHAQTPMTGAGFEEAVTDAAALADAFTGTTSPEEALRRYEYLRLADMRRRVSAGRSFSTSFTRA
ncbi:FAD-dependent monooxygenase [Actinocorallia sp. API 0066]|uniref:FAD-dependent monooxygenase n=1 Tax=Actinocorallia sp. API 0066 TaxID=2896846 RepID=UPI001E4F3134|nr:NAD(P)/FAD-dependent oxidoreductase [Actinocorallia sp. API 0066]MCD0451706.1 FAD-dependent monooxygenase [Actinocorallia sp. API 0066]